MRIIEVEIGAPVVYWPVKKADGTFEGIPLYTQILSEPWDLCGQMVVKVAGKSGGVALDHLELQNILSAEIIQQKKEPGDSFSFYGKRVFTTELEAQEKFDVLTEGGFEQDNVHCLYMWDLVVTHRTEGKITRRTLYTRD
jgi:hypothetical protein